MIGLLPQGGWFTLWLRNEGDEIGDEKVVRKDEQLDYTMLKCFFGMERVVAWILLYARVSRVSCELRNAPPAQLQLTNSLSRPL